ncbi:MAG: hypothetical protein ACXWZQ_11115 [Candidatus Binatia bacterium]
MASFEKIELLWFPRPGVVFRDTAISFDQQIGGKIQQLTLYLSLRHMLTGSLTFSSVTADGAAWIVRLPARDDAPFNLDELEEKVRAFVKHLGIVFQGMNLRVRRGTADISRAGGPSLKIADIDANLGLTLEKLALTISAGANVADGIRFTGEVATGTLASEARLSVENLNLRKAFEFFSPGSVGGVDDGALSLSVKLTGEGLNTFRAEIAGSLPSLTLARGARKALIAAKNFKAVVTGDEKVFRVDIEALPLASPPGTLAGELIFHRPSSLFSAMLTGRDIDVGMIRKSALLLADDFTAVHDVFLYLQGGAIAEVRVEARGRSIAEALASKQSVMTADLRDVKIYIPGRDLALANVTGAMIVSAGVLECKKCSATLGKAKGRDGMLRVGLTGANRPFHLDIMVETEARELQSLLMSHVKDEAFRKEISRIYRIDGSLSGRLVLGETLETLSAKFSAVPAALTASYEPVPYPISLSAGRLTYDSGRIEAQTLAGAVGRSSFAGLTGSIRVDGTEQVTIKSASLQLDLAQTELLIRKVATIHAKLGPGISAIGKIDFASIALSGPLSDPSQWSFTGKGEVEGLRLNHAGLPAPVAVSQGSFDASHDKVSFAKTKVDLLDASMTVGGVVENWRKAPFLVEATASGVAGERVMEWARAQTEIPADYMLRSPLEFSSSRLTWRDDGNFSFTGKLTVAQGPRLSIDMERNGRSLTIKELSIDDGGQSARGMFALEPDKWGASFSGTLNKRTLDRMFLTAPVPLGLLQGDFAVNVFAKPPYRLSARGTLAGKDIIPPLKGEDAVIEQFEIHGDPAGLNIRSADLRWRRSRIALSGKLAAAQDVVQVDMDVAADRLVWEEFSALAGTASGQKEQSNTQVAVPAVNGVVRLMTERLDVGTWSWSPLQVVVQINADGITGEVENSVVCGIGTAGPFTVQKNDQIKLDMRLSVQDGDLDATSRCLSSEKSNISGTYSLDARLTGSGNRDRLARTLSGEFDFVARDGKFIRSVGVDATFDYLNQTGDFSVAFPDLNREAYPYRLISAKGTVAGQNIFAKEIIVEASPYAIAAQANADLEQKTIDAKGLVTVLLPADKIIKNIPLVGSIVSGSMVGIPVEVTGGFEQPQVSYSSLAALGAEIVNVPLRILGLPLGMLQIFTPRAPEVNKQ